MYKVLLMEGALTKKKSIPYFQIPQNAGKEKLTKGPDDDRKVLRGFSYSPHPNQQPYTSLKACEAFDG